MRSWTTRPGPTAVQCGEVNGDNRVPIPLFLAFAFLFFITYQLFGIAATAVVIVLFCFLALAAHCVRVTHGFPFLHLSLGVVGRGDGVFEGAEARMDATAISALLVAFGYKRDHGHMPRPGARRRGSVAVAGVRAPIPRRLRR